MIYIDKTQKDKLRNYNKKSITIFIILSISFIILTLIILLTKDKDLLSLILEISLSSTYFYYLLIFIKILLKNKRYISLYNKLEYEEEIIEGIIQESQNEITIDQILFNKISIKTTNGLRQLYMLKELKINFKANEYKKLIISGNYIKGEISNEESTN